jgi:hypothetical protein
MIFERTFVRKCIQNGIRNRCHLAPTKTYQDRKLIKIDYGQILVRFWSDVGPMWRTFVRCWSKLWSHFTHSTQHTAHTTHHTPHTFLVPTYNGYANGTAKIINLH